jgi:hypothetical protein
MMPTTSMILKTRKDFSGPALSRSHVHQEAVVSRGQPPRNVFGPVEISGYLTFLRSEVTKYAEKAEKDGSAASLKAMKRALSFLLMIGADQNDDLRDELEGLISDLVTPAVGGIVVEQRIEELDTLEQDAAVEVRPSLRQEIAAIRSEFQHYMLEEDEKTLVLAGASQAASALKDMIEELFAAVGH